MAKVYVTRPIPETGLNLLRQKGFDVRVNQENRVLSKDELKQQVQGVEAILSLLTDKIDDEVLAAAGPQLKIVANYAVGFDNIDLSAAHKRKVLVTNTPEVLTEAVAEHTITLMMAAARRLVESDTFTRQGRYRQWEPLGFLGLELKGKTLGVVGLGRIGSRVAEIAKGGLGMAIVYFDIRQNPEFEENLQAKFLDLESLLSQADVVSVHVPLLESTRHLINAERLKMMKKTAILINTSRGAVVDEAALVEALKNQTIMAAGLDVFEQEPDLSPGLIKLPNVVLTPHTASATYEAREAMSKMAAENIIDALEGRTPSNVVSENRSVKHRVKKS